MKINQEFRDDYYSESNSSVSDAIYAGHARADVAKELAMLKLIKQNNQLRAALARRDKGPKEKIQVDPFILKQLMEEIANIDTE